MGNPPPPACPPPWAATNRVMTSKAGQTTYEQFIAAGWSDFTLVENGYMEKNNMSFPTSFSITEPARSLEKIHKDLLARIEVARSANESAANARDQLREVRDEYQAAFTYFTNEANRELAS